MGNVMEVLRLEDPDGMGPFAFNSLARAFDRIAACAGLPGAGGWECWHNRFRTPWEEPRIAALFDGHLCAFRDIEQFCKWFPCDEMCELLRDRGFRLRTFSVLDKRPVLLKGRDQVVFQRDHASVVLIDDVCPTSIQ